MSGGWEPGDLAMCIFQGEWFAVRNDGAEWKSYGPRSGQILTVRAVARSNRGNLLLFFADYPDPAVPGPLNGYRAIYFRKITPPAADEFDREVIAALTGQPEQVPA